MQEQQEVQQTVEQMIAGASEKAQETLLNALGHYNRISQEDDLKLGDLKNIISGTNLAMSRLNKEGIGYDGRLAPRTEEERITGMDVPLIRINDAGLWEKI